MKEMEETHLANLLDGKQVAKRIQSEIKREVAEFCRQGYDPPKLAAVLVGGDPASEVYVHNKERACHRVGMLSELHRLPESTTTAELLLKVGALNQDATVHGILVQLPLPKQIDTQTVLDAVSADKDVDAFHPYNVGLISQGRPRFLPCTPHGVAQLLAHYHLPTRGQRVCIIGRSDIVGKPMASMLVQKDYGLGGDYANATVTICHSQTPDLPELTRQADILIAAIGSPRFVNASMVKPGAVVIDVGINRTDQGLVGDVDFDQVANVASHLTPVPGGIGPLTVTMLLKNTLAAARRD